MSTPNPSISRPPVALTFRYAAGLIRRYPGLMLLSLAHKLFALLLLVTVMWPLLRYVHTHPDMGAHGAWPLIGVYAIVLLYLFVIKLFKFLVLCVKTGVLLAVLRGRTVALSEVLRFTVKAFYKIYGWVTLASTLGIFLMILPVQCWLRGTKLFHWLHGLPWLKVNYFIRPLLMTEPCGPVAMAHRSSAFYQAHQAEMTLNRAAYREFRVWNIVIYCALMLPGLLAFLSPTVWVNTLGIVISLVLLLLMSSLNEMTSALLNTARFIQHRDQHPPTDLPAALQTAWL